MKKKVQVLLPLLCICFCAAAQQLSPAVVASAGGHYTGQAFQIEWTLGQTAVATAFAPAAIYTQGFHQPGLQVTPVTATTNLPEAAGFMVAPNPAEAHFTLFSPAGYDQDVQLVLTDLNGKELQLSHALAGQPATHISLARYGSGLFFLHVRSSAGETLRTFRIIKAQ